MSSLSHREPTRQPDILDEQFGHSKALTHHQPKQQSAYKNFYKQQLDELVLQKNQYRSMEKQRQEDEKRIFNERIKLAQEAQKIKELSYKNYYQMIMNNQDNIKNNYINPFQQRDQEKDKLIHKGLEVGKVRSQMDYQRQLNRNQAIKKEFQSALHQQLNQKEEQFKKQHEEINKINNHLKHVLLTPHQIQRQERERKIHEMQRYRDDLDKFKNQKYNMSHSQLHNLEHLPSIMKTERHNILLNPLPFNIQNPYILKQMQRKSMHVSSINNNLQPSMHNLQSSMQGNIQSSPYSSTRKNIFG